MTPYYTDGSVTLYLGDCREILPSLSPSVVVTDPPYGIGWKRSLHRARGSVANVGIANDSTTAARDEALALLPDIPAAVFGSLYAPFPAGLRHVCIYLKPPDSGVVGSTTGYRRDVEAVFLVGPWPKRSVQWSSLLRTRLPNSGNPYSPAGLSGHPHAKPLDLMEQIISACPDGTVVDPFMGSGATVVAARNLGRRVIGIDIEERWCEWTAKRLAQGALDFGSEASA